MSTNKHPIGDLVRGTFCACASARLLSKLDVAVFVTPLTQEALSAFRSQWIPQGSLHSEGFRWDAFSQIPYYQQMEDRFEAAIWDGEDLIALGIGEADVEKNYVARDFNERAPTAAGARYKGLVVPMMNICLEEWAKVLGVEHICIFDPNLPSVLRLEREGFAYVSSIDVLGVEIGPAFYSYCTKPVVDDARPLDFVYSPVDLEELGEANDPFKKVSRNELVPAAATLEARFHAIQAGLLPER